MRRLVRIVEATWDDPDYYGFAPDDDLSVKATYIHSRLQHEPNERHAVDFKAALKARNDALDARDQAEAAARAAAPPIPDDDEGYRGQHGAASAESGAPLYDMTRIYPDDFYSASGHRFYDAETRMWSTVASFRGRPNMLLRVYRAVPKSVVKPKITPGDWVSLTRRYAAQHGRENLRNDFRIITKTVHARDLFTDGDSLDEWGYDPQPPVRRRRISEEARAEALVDTPAFNAWFGHSVVVDAEGRPLCVYHGTSADFDQFNDSGLIFFSTSPEFASGYALSFQGGMAGSRVLPCYLSIQKPFDYRTALGQNAASTFFDEMGNSLDPYSCEQVRIALHGQPDVDDADNPDIHSGDLTEEEWMAAIEQGAYPALECPEFVSWLKIERFDGMTLHENGSLNYAVFSPEQVKSVFNRGTFSKQTGRISEGNRKGRLPR